MPENGEPQFREVDLSPEERDPLKVIEIGLSPLGSGHDTWLAHALVDFSTRPDMQALVEAHRQTTEGDCTTYWFTAPEYGPRFCLLMSFTAPLQVKAIIAFDLVRHGAIVDCFVNGQGQVNLVTGTSGEHLQDVLPQARAMITVPVGGAVERTRWESVWSEAVAKELDIPRDEATAAIQYWRTDTRLRATNPDLPPLHQLSGVVRDEESKQLIFVSNQVLINRLNRDIPRIAESFDKHFGSDLEELSSELGILMTSLVPALLVAGRSGDQLLWSCSQLIGNALESLSGSVELLRTGRRLQCGVLLRTAVEAGAMAAHLYHEPADLGRFLTGKLDSAATVGKVKTLIPFLTQFWGHLSNSFTHLGSLYKTVQAPDDFDSPNDAGAKTGLLGIDFTLRIIWSVSEVIFYDSFPTHRYWSRKGPGEYIFEIRDEVLKRMDEVSEKYKVEQ